MRHLVALFGESERGEFRTGYLCQTLEELSKQLGEPPSKDCQGISFAVQALLYKQGVLFFRVHEEGFSFDDYLEGLSLLKKTNEIDDLSAISLPGVGDSEIIDATQPILEKRKCFLIMTDRDLYDYLTCKNQTKKMGNS